MTPTPQRSAAPPARRPRAAWLRPLAHHGWRPGLIVATATVLVVALVKSSDPVDEHLPDFAAIEDTAARKAAFIDHLAPLARRINDELAAPRARLLAIDAALASGQEPGRSERRFMQDLAEHHGLPPAEPVDRVWLARLISRVDTVPPSLIVAQAALESGWGTSRFAREGNALFGLRCHTRGCGMVPRQRASGATFEVAAYPDPAAAVRAYVHNLNTHPRYRGLRRLRAQLRAEGQPVTGATLATGLLRYSEIGSDYITLVRDLIAQNNLAELDR